MTDRLFYVQSQLLNHYNDVADTFDNETDRASAILAASYLENLLEIFLKDHMVEDDIINSLFTGQGALSTFSSRIAASYAFKFIPYKVYRDLDLIRKIRNHFAHNMSEATYEDEAVRNRISCFELFKEVDLQEYNHTNRQKFLITVGIISIHISHLVSSEISLPKPQRR